MDDRVSPLPENIGTKGRLTKIVRITAQLVVVALLVFAVGFVWFANSVSTTEMTSEKDFDAVVVLTGGRDRVARALQIMQDGNAKRLLISGVHPETTTRQIAATTQNQIDLFSCCVDLDRRARNTEDNAREAADWADKHGFKKILVVTSSYHMPRSLVEFTAVMDDVELVPYPVFSQELPVERWWTSYSALRILTREYLKYIRASIRVMFQ
ncbi:MAG: YdcF family protein [Stappiaceae bacterium]